MEEWDLSKGREMAWMITVKDNHSYRVRGSHPLTHMCSGLRSPRITSLSFWGKTVSVKARCLQGKEWKVRGANISPEGFGRSWGYWRLTKPCSRWGSCSALSHPGRCGPAPLRADWGNSAWLSGLLKATEMLSEGLLPSAESQTTTPD